MLRVAIGLIWSGRWLVVGERAAGSAYAGLAEFPGGKVEALESPAEAVVRECHEETGLRVAVVRQRLVLHAPPTIDRLELFFFDCRPLECADNEACDTPPPLAMTAPFAWRQLRDVVGMQFPPANAVLLEQFRADLMNGP